MESDTLYPAALTRHVTRIWPRSRREALLRAAADVRLLEASDGWRALTQVLAAEIEAVDRSLGGTHKALEHADYALLHGRRAGLRANREAAGAILDRAALAEKEIDSEDAAEPATP